MLAAIQWRATVSVPCVKAPQARDHLIPLTTGTSTSTSTSAGTGTGTVTVTVTVAVLVGVKGVRINYCGIDAWGCRDIARQPTKKSEGSIITFRTEMAIGD